MEATAQLLLLRSSEGPNFVSAQTLANAPGQMERRLTKLAQDGVLNHTRYAELKYAKGNSGKIELGGSSLNTPTDDLPPSSETWRPKRFEGPEIRVRWKPQSFLGLQSGLKALARRRLNIGGSLANERTILMPVVGNWNDGCVAQLRIEASEDRCGLSAALRELRSYGPLVILRWGVEGDIAPDADLAHLIVPVQPAVAPDLDRIELDIPLLGKHWEPPDDLCEAMYY